MLHLQYVVHGLVTGSILLLKFKLEDINDVAEKMLKRQITGRWVCEWD